MFSKRLCITILSIGLMGTILFLTSRTQKTAPPVPIIGIIQTATHPALDQARESFTRELSRLLNGRIEFIIQNAEGSLPQALSIAKSFHTHTKISAIFAIGTLAVQAAARFEQHKPIFIAAVSDPESLHILFPGTNVCGTSDRINTDAQADLIKASFPAAKTVAILYNQEEANSQAVVENMKLSLENRGLNHLCLGVHSENQLAQTISIAINKADVILTPPDNLIAGAMPLLSKMALKKKCPVIASDVLLVDRGALMAQGVNYKELGKQTAIMAHKVLAFKQSPEKVGIAHPSELQLSVNARIAEILNLSLPRPLD